MKGGNGLNCNGNDSKKRKSKQHGQQQIFMSENDYRLRLQEIRYTLEHILMKVFQKDGPPLGAQFDCLPLNAFVNDSKMSLHEETRRTSRIRKGTMHGILDFQVSCENSSLEQSHGVGKAHSNAEGTPGKKHGMGKGLMTQRGAPGKKHGMGKGLMSVWRATTTDILNFSSGVDFSESTIQKKRKRSQSQQSIVRKLAIKEQSRKKTSRISRKMECLKVQKPKLCKEKCDLALGGVKCLENSNQSTLLVDDEELELRESQAGPNPLCCSAHFPIIGSHGCSLCKDLLAMFPPNSVKMEMPLLMQPWASSTELVKKLFKVFHFLCTYAVTVSIYSFTFDDFAHAFHEKDSLLLGQVHLALLKVLLKDVKKELGREFLSHARKNCKFLGLLLALEPHTSVLEFWQNSLNLLTWTEILRQVLVAAGFGSKLNMVPKEACNKEINLMRKYGLSPGTLKGELFCILLTQVNSGMKVSELAKSPAIAELNLTETSSDLENLITLSLSGDMTLFEKISSSGYRLRISSAAKESEGCSSVSDDFGSIDDVSEVNNVQHTESDSEYGSRVSSPVELDVYNSQSDMMTVYSEIDESYPGETWLLGLMEGEYSNLNIDQKLSALTALIDLLCAGSTITLEDPLTSTAECPANINHYSSGAKIKRSTMMKHNSPGLLGICDVQTLRNHDFNTTERPIDSLVPMSKLSAKDECATLKRVAEEHEAEGYLHTMQSIYLGSDRRYNRYWLFLGPCDELDPGHRRIYFESSEDGHWKVIDTQEALCTLMLALDSRGAREAQLLASLEKRETFLCQATSTVHNVGNTKLVQCDQSELNTSREASSSPVSDVDNRLYSSDMSNSLPASFRATVVNRGLELEQTKKSGHSLAYDSCMWNSFYKELNTIKNRKKTCFDTLRICDHCHDLYWRDEKHCRICHITFELDFDLEERYAVHSAICRVDGNANKYPRKRVLSSQLQVLKAAIYSIESAVPEDALLGSWKKSAHNLWVNRLRRVSSLAEFLQVLADFVTAINENWLYQNSICIQDHIFSDFSTMPRTYSAVALWLVKLDLLVASRMDICHFSTYPKL